ncbi:hypothetical protein NTGZN8_340089 [Candidatus Nitrotoga fabula]|uniref:Uncharacterized protein n=1 Tax=Candidatus Nitrotoga fabula TaxID=2182327 RepID=A0A916FAT1_9PROT|nr:hypothetical protein NTGZN8_340089 [Candidatus Nitrotoga fabula]
MLAKTRHYMILNLLILAFILTIKQYYDFFMMDSRPITIIEWGVNYFIFLKGCHYFTCNSNCILD